MTREDVWRLLTKTPDDFSDRELARLATVAVAFELREIAEQLKHFNNNCVTETATIKTTEGSGIHISGALRTRQVPD